MTSPLQFPTAQACIRKLSTVVPVPADADLLGDIDNILSAVCAEFQGPVGKGADGCGTGRTWGAVTETRAFNGGGYAGLVIDDFDPTQPISVSVCGNVIAGVVVEQRRHGLGANTINRGTNGLDVGGFWNDSGFGNGEQNVMVTATWGTPLTADIVEAIKCEVCYRAMIQGYVDLAGVGETLTMGEYSNATASGISVWGQSSPIAIFHKIYTECVQRYRDDGAWRRTRLFQPMS